MIKYQTQRIPLKDIVLNDGRIEGLPKNPRQWKREDIEKLRNSIKQTPELLEARGVLVYPYEGKYVALGGNLRLEACKAEKMEDVPCIIVPEDTPIEKLKEIVIKDNSSFGQWDYDLLANEWDDLPLLDWGVPAWDTDTKDEMAKKEAEEDNFDEDQEHIEGRCNAGDIWQLGDHRLMCGSATSTNDLSKLMEGQSVDLYLTDPLYNVDYEGGNGLKIQNDKMTASAFENFLHDIFTAVDTVMKPGTPFYIWMSTKEEETVIRTLRESTDWLFKQIIIWVKNHFNLGRQDYQWQHEPCIYGWKNGAGHYFINDRTNSTVYEDAELVDPKKMTKSQLVDYVNSLLASPLESTVIREDKPLRNAEHPTMKPIKLFGRLINNSSRLGDNILDSFGGSGTTLIAAEQLGRKAFIMELDPHYCDVILARWEKFTGRQAVKVEPKQ